MTWAQPVWLAAVVCAPIALLLLILSLAARRRAAAAFSRGEPQGLPTRTLSRFAVVPIVLALLALTAAEPHWGQFFDEVERSGADIVVVLDLSRSMLAEDAVPSRLERAKREVRGLIEILGDDRIALVTFAGRAEMACPLTADHEVFRYILDYSDTSTISNGGSNLASAMEMAADAFDVRSTGKAVVLLTDGEFQGIKPDNSIVPLIQSEIRLFVIGVGTRGGAKIPIPTDDGRRQFLTDARGNEVISRMNREALEALATQTGGAFLTTQDTAFPMDEIYQKRIRFLATSAYSSAAVSKQPPRYQVPLFAAVALLVIIWFPRRTRVRTPVGATLVVGATLLLAIPLVAQTPTATPDGRELARRQRAVSRHPGDARYLYNWGTRLHQAGQRSLAEHVLRDAGEIQRGARRKDPSLLRDTLYNLGNNSFLSAEASDDPDKARTSLESARDSYAEALRLDPTDGAARNNLALTLRKLSQLPQQSQPSGGKGDEDKQDQQNKPPPPGSQGEEDEGEQLPTPTPGGTEGEQDSQTEGDQRVENALDEAEANQRTIDQYKAEKRRQGNAKDW